VLRPSGNDFSPVGAAAPCAAIGMRATGTVAPTCQYAATPSAGPQSPAPQRPAVPLSEGNVGKADRGWNPISVNLMVNI